MRKIWIALLTLAPCLFAQGDEKNCKEVSGGIVTNVLAESGTVNGMNFVATSLGTATGDLRGGIGVYFLSITGVGTSNVVAKVHHHWVTEAGDTIFAENATANAFQVGTLAGVFVQPSRTHTRQISLVDAESTEASRDTDVTGDVRISAAGRQATITLIPGRRQ